jgi:uncharacterized membrane-anchored protein
MRRVVAFLIVGIVVIAAAWSLGNLQGHVSASIGSMTIETSASFAILALILLFVVAFVFLRVLFGAFRLPRAGAGWRRRHRLRLGERAITRVLVALAAGEQTIARKQARRARALLGPSPQTLLLVAEAGRLSGREDEAEEAFRALTQDEDGRFLGYRGLLRQAVERNEWGKANAIAREAEAAHPGTMWLRRQSPHPDLADFALAREHDALARYQRAKRLTADNPEHPESRLLLGKTAVEAGLTADARHQAEAALSDGVNERRLWLLITDIEEKERGDSEEGRQAQRDALRRAAVADPDPDWRCSRCRSDHAAWSPKCPSCGAVGTLRWQSGGQVTNFPAVA